MATWPEWDLDIEWARLDGPVAVGSRGRLKPKGGPAVRFSLESVVPDREFVNVSYLPGARLRFSHVVTPLTAGGCQVDVTVSMSGPLAWVWQAIMGKGLAVGLQPNLDRLVAVVEGTGVTAG